MIFPGKCQISHSRPHGGGFIQIQVRKTDSVNDRKGKANQLLFILLTQKPMVWEGQVRDWGHVGWLENSSTCLDASKERKAQLIVGALVITSPSEAFVCRLHCRIDKTLCGLVKEGWQVFHVSPLLGKDISRSLITTGEQSSLGVLLFGGALDFILHSSQSVGNLCKSA